MTFTQHQDSLVVDAAGIQVVGQDLIVNDGAVLPRRCVKTNRPVSQDDMRSYSTYQCSAAIKWLSLFTGPIGAIAWIVARRKFEWTMGVDPAVQKRLESRYQWKFLLLIVAFLAVAFAFAIEETMWIVGTLGMFVAAVLFLISKNHPVRISSTGNGALRLRGCHETLLRELSE